MNNVFFEIDSDLYINVNHVVYVDFTDDDDNLGDSLLTISLSNGSELSFTLFELFEDDFYFNKILKFLEYLRLFDLVLLVSSKVHDLLLNK